MDKNKNLEEQEAPEKNTDNAFVRVREDGKPEIPDRNNTNEDESIDKKSPEPGSLADR